MGYLFASNEIATTLVASRGVVVMVTSDAEMIKEKEAIAQASQASPATSAKEELTIVSDSSETAADTTVTNETSTGVATDTAVADETSTGTATDTTAVDETATGEAATDAAAEETVTDTGAEETQTGADTGAVVTDEVITDEAMTANIAVNGASIDPGYVGGMSSGESIYVDPSMGGMPQVKDPLLSSWPFVIGISAAVLFVSVVLGILLAKRKIKKGIELYED